MCSSLQQAGISCLLRSFFHSVSSLETFYRLFSDLSGQRDIAMEIEGGMSRFLFSSSANTTRSFALVLSCGLIFLATCTP